MLIIQTVISIPGNVFAVKYIVFGIAFVVGVPVMGFMASSSAKLRGWLLTLLIFSTALGDKANINFVSLEAYRGPDRGFEVNLTDLIALGLVVGLLMKYPTKVRWLPYNSFAMFMLFGVACIATWMAPQRLLAFFTLFKLIKVFVLFWCVVNCLHLGTSRDYVWKALVGIGLFVTVLALKQKYMDGIYRIPGPFDHSNTVPLFLNLIMPSLLMWGLCDKRLSQSQSVISIVAALGMVFAVAATFSRAGTALAIFCLIGTLAIANQRAKSLRVTATSIIVFLAMLGGGIKAADSFLDRMRNAPKSSEAARDEFNVAASMMAREHTFGVGLNNFSHVLTVNPHYNEHIEVMANEEQAGVAHHIYWLTAAEMGYPGLAAFLIVIVRFAWLAVWTGWRSESVEGLILFGYFFGYCALHASGFLEWAFRITPVMYLFTITAGICVAFADVARQNMRPRPLSAQATG